MKDIVTEKDELLGVVSPSTQMHTLRFGRRRCYSTLASNRRGLWEGVDVEIEIGTSILQSHHMLGVHLPPQRLASDQLKRGVPCGKFVINHLWFSILFSEVSGSPLQVELPFISCGPFNDHHVRPCTDGCSCLFWRQELEAGIRRGVEMGPSEMIKSESQHDNT